MKFMIIVACLSAVILLASCGEAKKPAATAAPAVQAKDSAAHDNAVQPPQKAPEKSAVTTAPAKQIPPEVDGKKKEEPAKTTGKQTGVGDVVDYAIGATPLKVKKTQKKKINEIQDKHNKDLDKALEE
jgi:hypothetical protein